MQLARSKINSAVVEDICIGNVNEPGVPYKGQAASLAAGFPNTISVSSANRFCSLVCFQLATIMVGNGVRCNFSTFFMLYQVQSSPEFEPQVLHLDIPPRTKIQQNHNPTNDPTSFQPSFRRHGRGFNLGNDFPCCI
jgi:hypothetical protein